MGPVDGRWRDGSVVPAGARVILAGHGGDLFSCSRLRLLWCLRHIDARMDLTRTVAQLERDIIVERVKAGLRRAKSDGKKIGRPRVDADLGRVRQLVDAGYSTRKIAEAMG